MISEAQKLNLEKNSGVMLLQGQREDGQDFFVYMIMNRQQIDKLEGDCENGAVVDFTAYGTVIVAGKGEPTPDHISYMEKEYNFKHKKP